MTNKKKKHEIKTQNRFEALARIEEDEDENEECEDEDCLKMNQKSRPTYASQIKMNQKSRPTYASQTNISPQYTNKDCSALLQEESPELSPLMNGIDENEWEWLTITVDSGAADSVIPEDLCTKYKTRETAASKSGMNYVAANGKKIPYMGEKNNRSYHAGRNEHQHEVPGMSCNQGIRKRESYDKSWK